MDQSRALDDHAIENVAITLAVVFSALSLPDREWLNHVLSRTARAYPDTSITREALERICQKSEAYLERNVTLIETEASSGRLLQLDALAGAAAAHRLGVDAHFST